jgi:hypothetical protein
MDIAVTKGIYDKMVSHQFVVSIMGMFDQELLLSLINITDKKLSGLEVQGSVRKKIFHFMVECSQNLIKTEKTSVNQHNNIFLIGQDGDDYSVYLGSAVSKENLAPILATIAQVNSIEANDIKKKYYEELTSSGFVDQNFLLLSMLSISKRTRKKIDFDLIDINDQTAFLAFKMTMTN